MNIDLTPRHAVSPYLYMQFMEPLGNTDSSVDAAWDALNERWQPAFLDEIRRLAPPMLRWGGCFASYYHWREAVGPRSQRKPMYNLLWDGIYANQVGTAEFIDLCRTTGAAPLLVVNFESDGRATWARPRPDLDLLGTAEEAADWVAYCNDPDHPLRRQHGHDAPYNVKYWQIGNETSYGYPTVGLTSQHVHDGFTLEQTIAATRRFANAMRAVDPAIKLLCWGDDGWAPRLCEELGDLCDLVAFHCHFGYSRRNGHILAEHTFRQHPEQIWTEMLSAADQLERKLADMKQQVAPYGKHLAMTESHFTIADGRDRSTALSTWTAGVAYARNLITLETYSDVLDIATQADFCGNRWQVNAMMIPTPSFQGRPYLMPVGEVMGLFSQHHGNRALELSGLPAGIHATATVSADGSRVFIHAVNTSPDHAVPLPLSLNGTTPASATAYEIACDPLTEIDSRCPAIFHPQSRAIVPLAYQLPAAGVAAIELTLPQKQD